MLMKRQTGEREGGRKSMQYERKETDDRLRHFIGLTYMHTESYRKRI